jgi:hypothetical protein
MRRQPREQIVVTNLPAIVRALDASLHHGKVDFNGICRKFKNGSASI